MSLEQASGRRCVAAVRSSSTKEYPKWAAGTARLAITLHEHLVGKVPVLDADAARRGGPGAAHRVRQRRQPDAGAGHRPRREMGIRAALGASRWRLVRGAAGRRARARRSRPPRSASRWPTAASTSSGPGCPTACRASPSIGIDLRVLAATIAAASLTGLPLRHRAGAPVVAPRPARRAEGRRPLGDRRRGAQRMRSMLVVAEVALAVVLLVGAGPVHRQLRQADARRPGLRLSRRARAQRRPAISTRQRSRRDRRAKPEPHLLAADARRGQARARRRAGGDGQRRPAADGQLEPHRVAASRPRRVRKATTTTSTSGQCPPGYLELLRIPLVARALLTADDRRTRRR